jgi:tetratricopeptide (TPR) repeat protein
MATISEALAIAIQHHQAGRLQAAEQIYRQILQVEPTHADAWHLLGLTARQVGRHEIAVQYIGRAIALNGNAAAFHFNLGNTFKDQGKLDEAVACYRRALELEPGNAGAHNNLGVALHDQGKLDEAVSCYRRVLESRPDYAAAHNNLGNTLKEQGKLDEAVACYRRALELAPDFAEARYHLGVAFQEQRKLDEAVACYRRALELMPDFAEAHCYLGTALKEQGKRDEAVACFHRALELKPEYAEVHNNLGVVWNEQGNRDGAVACFRRALELKPDFTGALSNLGNALKDQGRLDEAIASFRRALDLEPDYAGAHNNLGVAFQAQGKLDEATACYRRAIELEPDFADAHLNRSLVLLLTSDFEHGWAEYEWRWRVRQRPRRDISQAVWDGQPLEGRTILLHAEQGRGDAIQFVRYLPLVKRRGGTVILECPRPLLSLLTSCAGIDQLVGQGDQLPAYDVQAPLLSLPGIFRTSLRDIPATIPYLSAAEGLVEHWRQELGGVAGFKIGIAWQGNPTYPSDRDRSIPAGCFEPLAGCPGVRLLSLQKQWGVEQLQEVADRFPIMDLGSRLDHASGAFMDTAAVMMNLSLVVTSDTAIAHLAGALGVPVWVALSFIPDWRWLLDRNDSPWYPTMRLFRQDRRGDWQGVFERIEAALREHMGSQALRRNEES